MSGYYQKIGATYYDLNTIFSSYVTSNTKADATKFTNSSGIDLNSIFEKVSNQPTNLTVNYGFASAFQSNYFTPKATCSITSDSSKATISITDAAFNSLAIIGSGIATITGVSGTSSYSQSFTGLAPDSNYSYTCKPSNSGTSPAATTTVLNGTSTDVSTNTLPIIKNVSATVYDSSSITISWAATGTSDCSYSYVAISSSTSSSGTYSSITGATKILNTTTTFLNKGLSAGTTYYYAVTPYNKSGSAGTSVYVNATSFLNTTINTFTFSSISGVSSTTGWIAFNIKISNFTYATLTTGTTKVEIYQTTGSVEIQKAIQFDTAKSLTFTLSVYNSPGGGEYNGSTTPLTSVITYTSNTDNAIHTPNQDTNTFGYFYWMDVILVGSGGGGGGGSVQHGGGNGGGGGSGGYISYSESINSVGQNACHAFSKTVGIASAGGKDDGDGKIGYYGPNGNTSISFYIGNITYYFQAACGIGGAGGSSRGDSAYYPNSKDGNNYVYGETGSVYATKTVTSMQTLTLINLGKHAGSGQPGGKLGLTGSAGDGGNGSAGYGSNGDSGNPGLCSFNLYYLL